MDAANVEVISKHMIKPSSSTPSHLKTLKLSLLDQLSPPIYVPLILFYHPDELKGFNTCNHPQISQKLKQSLSDTLTLFYPLAGELNQENFTVDCNDNGAEFTEARVHARLSDDPNMEQLKLYLPLDPNGGLSILLAVQVNFFDCGGIAIGLCLSHQIADGASTVALINAWAKICRGDEPEPPVFGLFSQYFPTEEKLVAKRLILFDKEKLAVVKAKDKRVAKKFLFDKEKLAALRREATSSQSLNKIKDPTRVELVSAFIWKNLLSDVKLEINNTIVAIHTINLRSRASATLGHDLGNVFGNFFFLTAAYLHGASFDQYEGGSVPELSQFVGKLRHAIRRIDEEYVRSEDNYSGDMNKLRDIKSMGGAESCVFSSWCRFPVYEVDYGWGKPFWVGTTPVPLDNFACLLSTKCGDGIEALVDMFQDDATAFETQFKLLGTQLV